MNFKRFFLPATFIFAFLYSSTGQVSYEKEGNTIKMNFGINQFYGNDSKSKVFEVKEIVVEGQSERVTKKDAVKINVKGVNLYRYSLEFVVKEEVIESYNLLEGYISSIIDILQGVGTSNAGQPFMDWKLKIEEVKEKIDNFLSDKESLPMTITLSKENIRHINTSVEEFVNSINELKKLKEDAFEAIDTTTLLVVFNELDKEHKELLKLIRRLKDTNDKIVNGIEKTIQPKKAGTIVTVSITPKPNTLFFENPTDLPDQQVFSVEYFVESDKKLRFHTGFSQSSFDDIEFEKITSGGNDVFTLTK